ncbi:MAG: protein kinase domain-containing protein, partial [Gemmatimonadaceae bacterium]
MSGDLQSQLQTTLGSVYTIERELAGGGMARVFLAIDTALARPVVIKVLSPDLAAGLSAQRFAREIRLAASLQQANIVPVLSAGETGDLPFYTMPFVEGLSLRDRLRDGRITIGAAISILRDVTRALAYAHEHGVVHRDIKPENILLSGDAAVVTDFGIARALTRAKAASAAASESTITQFGAALGTPAYMAPEQVAADPSADHRADIYAFGCLAYELLSGATPFAGRPSQQLLAAHLGERPTPLGAKCPDCAPDIVALVMRCLEKDAAARPQSARDILTGLEAPNAPATSWQRLRNRLTQGQRRLAVATLVVLLTALAVPPLAWLLGDAGAERVASLAIIPCTNIDGDTAHEYLAEGMADEVTTALGKVTGVRVVSRALSARYRGRSELDPKAIGRELGVQYILSGTVRRTGGQLRVSTQLVSATDNSEAWSEGFAGAPEEAYEMQDSITRAVGHTLQRRLGGAVASLGVPAVASIGTTNAQAYDLYMRGKLLLARRGSGVAQAIEKFEQAIALDSNFARAYAGLGVALELLPIFTATPPAALHDRAIRVAQSALALDSTQAEAYTT